MIRKNKKGMYEFVLTKSIMLIFVLGLMTIFYFLYGKINVNTATESAQMEANQIATTIDSAIGFSGLGAEKTYILKDALMVGNQKIGYDLKITKTSAGSAAVSINLVTAPYKDVTGIAGFGLGVVGGTQVMGEIECKSATLRKGMKMQISKTDEYTSQECPKYPECPNKQGRWIIRAIHLSITVPRGVDEDSRCTGEYIFIDTYVPES